MDTIYLIDNSFVFNSSVHTLQRIESNETVNLAVSASLCLTLLLENQGEIILRHELLERVWGSRGMNVTTNTLYQNISLLRKSFSRLGIDTSMIQTAPRRGFLFDKNINVKKRTEDKDTHANIIGTPVLFKENAVDLDQTINYIKDAAVGKKKRSKTTIKRHLYPLLGSVSLLLFLIITILVFHVNKLDSLLDDYEIFTSVSNCKTYNNSVYENGSDYVMSIKNHNYLCNGENIDYMASHYPAPRTSTIYCQYPIALGYWSGCVPSPYF